MCSSEKKAKNNIIQDVQTNMNNYDNYITGLYDSDSPMNQPETEAEKVTYTEFLENELNQTYFKDFLSDYKDTVKQIYQTNKRILEIEQNLSIFGTITSDERIELHNLKKKLTNFIYLLWKYIIILLQ